MYKCLTRYEPHKTQENSIKIQYHCLFEKFLQLTSGELGVDSVK